MNDLTDQQLLRDYAECRSESAFAELVRRHIDLVHSTALRMVCDADFAKDVTQAVFVALAQSVRQIADRPVLCGWLHRTAQNLAAKAVRSDVRRRAREQEAASMNGLLSAEPDDATWEQIAPRLDDALGELSEPDRDALLLRYFERKSAHEMAQTLGISDDAAQKRVSRAVERLREFFAKRGITIGASGLVVVISANAVQAAPAGLAAAISTAALTGTTIATTATATAIKMIAMTTLQKTLITGTIAVAVGTGFYEAHLNSRLQDQVRALHQQQADRLQDIQQRLDEATNRLALLTAENATLKQQSAGLLKLRAEASRSRASKAELTIASDNATQSAAKSWLNRVSTLKERLEQAPEARIPELQLLTEQDWLSAARGELNSEADYRRALSALRDAGENKVVPIFKKGLSGYMQANGQPPTDLAQLQPYFDAPLDGAIIERWEIAPAKTVVSLGLGGDVIITQRAPVDDVFDTRFGIGPNGTGSTDFLSREVAVTMEPVWEAFRAAHNGESPKDSSQLLPYAATPEQSAALQKQILRESASK